MTITIDEVIQILKNDIELSKMNALFCHNNEYGIGALQIAVEKLEQTRWIPVSERLPKSDDDVLVTDDAGGLAAVGIDWFGYDGKWWCSQNVTAWMPLPEPYVPDTNDGKMNTDELDKGDDCMFGDYMSPIV